MPKTIGGTEFRKMIVSGAKILEINRAKVDSLNVFPVPDGDTGTNMSLTIQSAVKELSLCSSNRLSELCDAVSKGALKGARDLRGDQKQRPDHDQGVRQSDGKRYKGRLFRRFQAERGHDAHRRPHDERICAAGGAQI